MRKKMIPAFLLFASYMGWTTAQENRLSPTPTNPAEVYNDIKELGFLGSVLYIAAHPDDENTRLISYLANDRMARTAYLSLTRGDGGQNLIGPQLREQLGMIRTQELLEARNIDGGEQFFTRANDFGYSKHPDETLNIWNQEAITADVVNVIRQFRPDLIINRFDHRSPGTTHGHHTSSAMLSLAAFEAAGSTTAFPEQLENLAPWQPQRLFFNTSWWFYGSREAFAEADKTNLLEVDAGSYYPYKGLSNGEIAAMSRSKHKSQGFGSSGSRGSQIEYLEYLKGSFPENKSDLFSGINTTWTRVPGGKKIQDQLTHILESYDFKDPSASLSDLLKMRASIQSLPESNWKQIKLQDLEDIVLNITGLFLEASITQPTLTQGEAADASLELTNRSKVLTQIDIGQNTYLVPDNNKAYLEENESVRIGLRVDLPEFMEPTSPYYLQEQGTMGMYAVKDAELIGKPEQSPAISVPITINIMGYAIEKNIPLIHKRTDPVRGEVREPLQIVPQIGVHIPQPVFIFSESDTQTIDVVIKAYQRTAAGTVELCHPAGWQVSPDQYEFDALEAGLERSFQFEITAPLQASKGLINGLVKVDAKTFTQEVITLDYNHIPDQQLVRNNQARVVKPGLVNKAQTVAYINGAGDEVAQAIEAIGSKVFRFDPDEVPADLSKYDVVITGIRAFNVAEADMSALQARLDQYVFEGGTLLMQYNTSRGIDNELLGPLPITLSRKRVTEEDASVSILAPEHPLMNYPNTITQKDFEGWVQERGLYFPSSWDPAFTPLLGMNDKNEEMSKGSLIAAKYGEGHVIYTGLSLFRELPAGVSGAYRLLANMLSIGIEEATINTEDGERKF